MKGLENALDLVLTIWLADCDEIESLDACTVDQQRAVDVFSNCGACFNSSLKYLK